jgi:hypothetical protein
MVADLADLAAEHRVLLPEHQELGILGRARSCQPEQSSQLTYSQVSHLCTVLEPHRQLPTARAAAVTCCR